MKVIKEHTKLLTKQARWISSLVPIHRLELKLEFLFLKNKKQTQTIILREEPNKFLFNARRESSESIPNAPLQILCFLRISKGSKT